MTTNGKVFVLVWHDFDEFTCHPIGAYRSLSLATRAGLRHFQEVLGKHDELVFEPGIDEFGPENLKTNDRWDCVLAEHELSYTIRCVDLIVA
jgi:hypothetical protein